MKPKLLEFLKCLRCPHDNLELEIFEKTREAGIDSCLEGIITCPACGAKYPVIDGIPRFLKGVFLKNLFFEKPDFFRRHKIFSGCEKIKYELNRENLLKEKTRESFGFQWQLFGDMDEQAYRKHFLSFIDPPVRPDFFAGKTGLDIGCGFGRHMYFAAKWGAEILGVDLSDALYPAYKNTKDISGTYLLQADICDLPIKPVFDFAYSLGVLHHMPNSFEGFSSLSRLVKSGGRVFIWVYSKNAPEINFIVETLRLLLKNLPYKLLYLLCYVITFIEWYFVLLPYKLISSVKLIKKILAEFVPHHIVMYSGYPFKMNVADWHDRLSAPKRGYFNGKDLRNWFEKLKFKNIIISKTERYGYRAYGEK